MRLNLKNVLLVIGFFTGVLHTSIVSAQPSAARVRKDSTGPGTISFKLVGRGMRVWSKVHLQYVWDQSVVIVRKAGIPEYPNAKLEVGGIASYGYGGSFPYRRFYVTYNRYTGIPAPSSATIVAMVKKELPEFLGYRYNLIVGNVSGIALSKVPNWYWHTPNSVSFNVDATFTEKISSTQLEKKKAVYEVRLYRDGVKKPWKSFFSSPRTDVSLGKSTHDADDLSAMKTLNMVNAERMATNQMSGLPVVSIPAFKSDLEFFAWFHKSLREGNPQKVEAIVRRSLKPFYFENGSTVLLNSQGEEIVKNVIQGAFNKKSKYAEQYGPNPNVKHYQPNRIEFWNADGQHFSRMSVELSGGTWRNGEKVGQTYKISDLSIWVATDADEIARLRSMSPEKRFAPINGSEPFSALGQQVAIEKKIEVQAAVVKAIQWTPFTSANAKFSARFPGTPTETQGTMNDKYPMWTVAVKHPQVNCQVVAIIYPKSLNRMQAQISVDSAMQELAKSNNLTIKDVTEVNEGTYGRLATMESSDTLIKTRVFVLGEIMYQLILSSTPQTMATLNEREFFGSFQRTR